MLEREPNIEVVAEAGDADSAARYVSGHRPKVLILDINMPGGSGLAAIPSIREQSPDTEIVVLTMQDETAFAREALQAGVLGYILKEAASEELVKAVRMAAEGRTYLQPELGARLAAEPDSATPDDLSDRELEVLRLIALGHTNGEIAAQLYLSVRTVESHRAHIQQKTGARRAPSWCAMRSTTGWWSSPVADAPLDPEELRRTHAYWRAANYLSVGQIYLLANPLLREPLKLEHVKPRLLGHWGTTPGLNFIYAHMNRAIQMHDLNAI